MNLRPKKLFFAIAFILLSTGVQAISPEGTVLNVLNRHRPGVTALGDIKVEDVIIDNKKKTITVKCNEIAAYVPFTTENIGKFEQELAEALGYNGYRVTVTANGRDFKDLALFAKKKTVAPKEKDPFVTRVGASAAPLGLDGANIALWQSHGWYFEPKLNRWEWQRARIFQTVEDLYTQSYVMPFLMPMLENAGAYVMSPRERDINVTEIIVDNDGALAYKGYEESGEWSTSANKAFAHRKAELHNGDHPFSEGTARIARTTKSDKASATANWNADFDKAGTYAVYVSYTTEPNSSKAAHYTVHAADGDHRFDINQRMGAGTWIYLGHFPFEAGKTTVVSLVNRGRDNKSVVSADAVKIGGGMGNVARIVKEPLDDIDYKYVTSHYPRFVEGARYFLQWAGAPDSVFTPSDYVNDYGDDYKCRGLWVNWLAGGSSVLPGRKGLNIPVDLSFAFHSDAGTTLNDSIIGTLGIYSTANGTKPNGTSELASRDLTDLIVTNIVNDVRHSFEPDWTRRGMWDQSYFEARVPEVPAMLLELLSHQNFADMKYGLDPAFRFTVSRAVYKGMLEFIAHRDGREYVVQPLPVNSFAITAAGDRSYRLAWSETVDSLEATAKPDYYIIEERLGNGSFRQIAKVDATEYTLTVNDSKIHSYRIVAGNKGGVSFPSETLALCDLGNGSKTVTIVNGFTRVSAPDWFESGDSTALIGGFYDTRDHGVPYINDISYIGSMFEFRRSIPWMDDDAAGFGASRANYEDKVIAGNTFDYVIVHGQAIAAAGHSFVSSSLDAFCKDETTPAIIDLILGKQKETARGRGVYGTNYKAFPSDLQNKLKISADAGADIFVSGAYVATDIWDNPFSDAATAEADKKFAREVLGYCWRVGQASVTGEAYEVPSRFRAFTGGDYKFSNELNADCYAVESPDSFYPADAKTGATFMRYTENNLIAGTASRFDNYRTVVIGFPFETIDSRDKRDSLMKQILNFFDKKNDKK